MAKRWTDKDLRNIAPGRVKVMSGVAAVLVPAAVRKVNTDTEEKAALGLIVYAFCQQQGWTYQTEEQFTKERQFRFDWAIPEINVAIEYEGLFSEKSGHTTIKGFTKDCTKYNLAQIAGWKVLRYTAVNYMDVGKDLSTFVNQ